MDKASSSVALVKRTRSIRARLLSIALVWAVALALGGGWALSYAFRTTAERAFDARLTSLLFVVVGLVELDERGELRVERGIGDPQFERVYSGWYWLVRDEEGVKLRSRSLWDLSFTVPTLSVSANPTLWSERDPLGRPIRIAAQSVVLSGATRPVTFAVTGDLEALHEETRRFDWVLRIALAALGLGLVLAVFLQARYGLRPLQEVAHQVERVRKREAQRLEESGTRELDMLIEEINSLIEHNRRLVERARASAGDLAHALKTPLAIMQSATTQDSPLAREQREQIAAMERIITRHLARASAAGPGNHPPVPIASIVSQLIRGLNRIHAERGLNVESRVAEDLSYAADRQDLEEMIGNLIENAYKWARHKIVVGAHRTENRLVLAVEDDGPGIPETRAELATERGTRLDESAPGSGLGLSIVRDLAEIHGGTVKLEPSPLGGLRAELQLPT